MAQVQTRSKVEVGEEMTTVDHEPFYQDSGLICCEGHAAAEANLIEGDVTMEINGNHPAAVEVPTVPETPAVKHDPFDLAALRSAPSDEIQIEKVTLTVPVRKPTRAEFFRVHPDDEYVVDCWILEREQGFDRQAWWVDGRELLTELVDDAKKVRLFTCINKRGAVFLWAVRLPTLDGGGNQWYASALSAAELAKTSWLKLRSSRDIGSYEGYKAEGDLGDPAWPNKTLEELIRVAFKDRVIDSLDHIVIQELRGIR
jgi:hypothetical protein